MQKKSLDKLSKHSLNELAYKLIKEDIISCELLPGMVISEGLLLDRFKLSKSPTRSALIRLKQDGLITSRGRQGSVISKIMISDVQEISHCLVAIILKNNLILKLHKLTLFQKLIILKTFVILISLVSMEFSKASDRVQNIFRHIRANGTSRAKNKVFAFCY